MTFSEAATVQRGIVARLTRPDLGWTYLPGASLPRRPESPFIESELATALLRLNPAIADDPRRVDDLIARLRLVAINSANDGLVASNERMTSWLRGAQLIRFAGERSHSPVVLIDFENIERNSLVVSDEVAIDVAGRPRRLDIVLWVNGLPLVVGETKSPVDRGLSWLDGAADISNVYATDATPFFVPNVLSFATEGREFHYGAVGQRPEHWPVWGSTTDSEDLSGWERVERSVELLLAPSTLLSLLRNYTLYEHSAGRWTKLLPRYPQFDAAEAIHRRVGSDAPTRGLIWHFQGSGKTLLMAAAALRLLNDPLTSVRSVVIVLDRVDLVEQTVRQFQTVGLPLVQVAASSAELREMLKETRRSIIVTTIFKFAGSTVADDRDDAVVFVDEAHRTQEGVLGADLRRTLPAAGFFGLTGTPIVDSDRDTFRLFGSDTDTNWILSRYSMSRSIADGVTVPIHVESRLVDYHIDARALDAAFEAMADEASLDDEGRELLAERAARTKTLLAQPDRIAEVCRDIVDHYLTRVAPLGLKAQIVAYDRELCVLYHEEIERILAEHRLDDTLEATVVMTVGASKDEPAEWTDRYRLDAAGEARVKARFNNPRDRLSLLIVTAKLLTGFDAPIEGVLYLDKPLRRHTLFQAICRTNRRFTNPIDGREKNFGLVVDYVGLGADLIAALRSADPSGEETDNADIEDLALDLGACLSQSLGRFVGIDRDSASFDSLAEAQQRIPAGEVREDFVSEFRALEATWEFLYPHPALRERRGDYRWLASVYRSITPLSPSRSLLWHRLGPKTESIIQEHIARVQVEPADLADVIVDAEILEAISRLRADEPDPEPVSVGDAIATIAERLAQRARSAPSGPAYRSLSDRLEQLRQRQVQRTSSSADLLRELLQLARDLLEAERAVGASDTGQSVLPSEHLGALTQIVNEYAPASTPDIVRSVVTDIDLVVTEVRFSGWTSSQPGDRAVRLEIRRILRKYSLPTTGNLFDETYGYVRENY
jgi:type I restriction enzyme R subunit